MSKRTAVLHGVKYYSTSKEFSSWRSMRRRCHDCSKDGFYRYGGRGIKVCDRWLGQNGFQNFLIDMGPSPSDQHSIDRIDNDGNYTPENCRWSTIIEQSNNKSNNHYFTFYNTTLTLTQWSNISQIKTETIRTRLRLGWSEQEAVWTPVRKRK